MRANKEAAFRTWWDQRMKEETTVLSDRKADAEVKQRRLETEQLTTIDRQTAKAYIDYRFRQCLNPQGAGPLPDQAHPLTSNVVQLTDRVLQKELQLLQLQIEGEEEKIQELRAETESLAISTDRIQELNAIFDSKVRDGLSFERRLAEVLQSDEALALALEEMEVAGASGPVSDYLNNTLAMSSSTGPAGRGGGGKPSSSSSAGLQGLFPSTVEEASAMLEETATSPSAAALHLLEYRVKVQKALSDGEKMSPVSRYLELLTWTSELSQLKHRGSFDRSWCESAVFELNEMQKKMEQCMAERTEREKELADARDQVDAAQRAAFSLRKDINFAHKRLVEEGSSSSDILRQITSELNIGVSDGLMQFIDSMKKDGQVLGGGTPSSSSNTTNKHFTPKVYQRQSLV